MKQNIFLSFFMILVVLLVAQFSFAQNNKKKSAPQTYPDVYDPLVENSPFKFKTQLSLSYEQGVAKNSEGETNRGLGFSVSPKFVFWDFSIRADLLYIYDLNQPRPNSTWTDGVLTFSYNNALQLGVVKFSPYTSLEIPMSRNSREFREIRQVNNLGVVASLDSKALGLEKLSLSYSAAYGYFTNKYTTRVNGDPANEYKIVQSIKAGYDFNPISISTKIQFANLYSYDNVARSSFLIVENVSYQHSEQLGFSLYHYNQAPFLKDSTYENNLQIYDKETSTVGFSTDISLSL